MNISGRDEFFANSQRELAELYLADPSNPYQQSGRSSGAARWHETRSFIADAVDRDGSFLDVGCANGLLLETLALWLTDQGLTIEPFGLDFIPELVDLARERIPHGRFWVHNAWSWVPPRSFDYVRTNLEYVPVADRSEFVERQRGWVAGGGRLILCHYRDRGTEQIDAAEFLETHGYGVVGAAAADGVSVAWTDL